jgi:membrane-associated phospholipid phosphatase
MSYQRLVIAYLLVFILAQAVFAAFPGIDLAVSRLFAAEGGGFTWATGPGPTINLTLRRLGEIVTLILILAYLVGLFDSRFRGDDLRLVAYPVLSVALASGVIANLLLKHHVGRARPDTVAEFGGTADFSPAWQVVRECSRNCSFTSGEVALAAGLALPILAIFWPHLTHRGARPLAIGAAVGYIALVALLRIGLGRHFLSDAVFSVLFGAGAALALYPVLRIDAARRHLTWRAARRTRPQSGERRGVH